MKKILCLVFACVLLMLSAVTASAANVSNFNLTLVSQTDSQAVLTFDFAGGTSFSALDFDVKVNASKVKVVEIEEGDALFSFRKQATVISQSNVDITPAKVTAAMIPGYRNVNGKDLFKITVKKLTKENLTADDITIVITNCADDKYNLIGTSITSDLPKAGAQTSTDVDSGAENSTTPDGTENSTLTPGETTTSTSIQIVTDAEGNTIYAEANRPADGETTQKAENTTVEKKNDKTTVIIICTVAAVVVGGAAVAAVLVMKKKKSSSDAESKED